MRTLLVLVILSIAATALAKQTTRKGKKMVFDAMGKWTSGDLPIQASTGEAQ